jgi:hypothetical protein
MSIFWLNATSEVSLKTSLRQVANRVLPPETVNKLDDEQIYIHVSNWFSEHANTRWLSRPSSCAFFNSDLVDQKVSTQGGASAYINDYFHGRTRASAVAPASVPSLVLDPDRSVHNWRSNGWHESL